MDKGAPCGEDVNLICKKGLRCKSNRIQRLFGWLGLGSLNTGWGSLVGLGRCQAKLGMGEGDCDESSDCEDGLRCVQDTLPFGIGDDTCQA